MQNSTIDDEIKAEFALHGKSVRQTCTMILSKCLSVYEWKGVSLSSSMVYSVVVVSITISLPYSRNVGVHFFSYTSIHALSYS